MTVAAEIKREVKLEIVHVLFLDIVGYSKCLTDEQQQLIDRLNQAVRGSDEFQKAAAADRLIKIPTGDGMALIFYNSPEQPVNCAREISRTLKDSSLPVRMGVHSGPGDGARSADGSREHGDALQFCVRLGQSPQ